MNSLVKNIIKMALAVVVVTAFALIFAEIAARVLPNSVHPPLPYIPGGTFADWQGIALGGAFSIRGLGSIWAGFWLALAFYFAWRIMGAVSERRDVDRAPARARRRFIPILLLHILIQAICIIVFLTQVGLWGFFTGIGAFWVFFLPLAYVLPVALCLIFFSKEGLGPFRPRRKKQDY